MVYVAARIDDCIVYWMEKERAAPLQLIHGNNIFGMGDDHTRQGSIEWHGWKMSLDISAFSLKLMLELKSWSKRIVAKDRQR